MCEGRPSGVAEALGMLDRSLAYLATADAACLPSAVQAEALRALARERHCPGPQIACRHDHRA